ERKVDRRDGLLSRVDPGADRLDDDPVRRQASGGIGRIVRERNIAGPVHLDVRLHGLALFGCEPAVRRFEGGAGTLGGSRRSAGSSVEAASPPETESAYGTGPQLRIDAGGAWPVVCCPPPARFAVARSQRTLRRTPSSTSSTRRLGVPSKSNFFGSPRGSTA